VLARIGVVLRCLGVGAVGWGYRSTAAYKIEVEETVVLVIKTFYWLLVA